MKHAGTCVTLSRLAYLKFEDDTAELVDGLRRLDYSLLDHVDNAGTQAFVAYHQQTRRATVAFRGTEKDRQDIMTDLKIRFRELPDGTKVHRGFWAAYQAVREPLNAILLGRRYVDAVDTTGHSLGGPLACVAAGDMARLHPVRDIYSFGCPRFGNEEYNDALRVQHWRFVNKADIVPRVPLLALGYRGDGSLIYRRNNGIVVPNPSWMTTWGDFVFSLPSTRLLAHRIAEYDGWLNR